jgi:hypothetical protein
MFCTTMQTSCLIPNQGIFELVIMKKGLFKMAIHRTTPTIKDELGKSGREGTHMRTSTGSPNLFSLSAFLSLPSRFALDKMTIMDFGADEFALKPITLDSITNKVTVLLAETATAKDLN